MAATVYQTHAGWLLPSALMSRLRLPSLGIPELAATSAASAEREQAAPHEAEQVYDWVLQSEAAEQANLLRDIFGNPFRPVTFDAAWRSDTVLSLAKEMYESRDFSAMPILADALQDAGCDNADILHHCRDEKAVGEQGPKPPAPPTFAAAGSSIWC